MRRRGARHGARPISAAGSRSRSCATPAASRATAARPTTSLSAARTYHLDAKGWKYDAIDKLRTLNLPAILFWNFNHFVVLDGFDEQGRASLNDPAQGPRLVSHDELDDAYSGVVLTFAPGPEFTPGGTPPDIIAALARRLEGNREALRYVLLCGLCLVVPGLVVPSFTRIFVDDYLIGGQGWLIRPLLVAMLVAAAVPGRADLAAAVLPAAARDQGRAVHVEPLLQAHPAAAGRATSVSASPARSARASRSTTASPR